MAIKNAAMVYICGDGSRGSGFVFYDIIIAESKLKKYLKKVFDIEIKTSIFAVLK